MDPAVLVTDASGNSVGSVAVTFSVLTGGGSVSPATPVNTTISGTATVTSWTLGSVRGFQHAQGNLRVAQRQPRSPSRRMASRIMRPVLAVETQPSANAQSGVVFPQRPVIQLEDASGNPVTQAGAGTVRLDREWWRVAGGNNAATDQSERPRDLQQSVHQRDRLVTRTLSFTATAFVAVRLHGSIVVAADRAQTRQERG